MKLRSDVTFAETPDGTVLLDGRSGRYWQLNPTGSRVLAWLLDGLSLDAVAARLADRHSIALEKSVADVSSLVGQLSSAGLVLGAVPT
ncbi:lasso peptide biosynthesis PqqD family chaperone [Lentzea alba]|uniref:lasso peptide biosynthesis PqqD family chaperone n=1 Tax=Lentzea alba TaxID=2714351 RepID=UPI0039BF7594